MKQRKIRYIIIGKGNECPKCNNLMERRGHKEQPGKTWFYKQWDYCKDCPHLQHYEEFKSNDWKQQEAEQNHLFNIQKE